MLFIHEHLFHIELMLYLLPFIFLADKLLSILVCQCSAHCLINVVSTSELLVLTIYWINRVSRSQSLHQYTACCTTIVASSTSVHDTGFDQSVFPHHLAPDVSTRINIPFPLYILYQCLYGLYFSLPITLLDPYSMFDRCS